MVFDSAGPSVLVPRSYDVFPAWEAGPLHGLFGTLGVSANAVNYTVSGLLIVMLVAYGVALAAVRTLSMRALALASSQCTRSSCWPSRSSSPNFSTTSAKRSSGTCIRRIPTRT